jgi:branched-chain amino acid transport system substrate-binding protein
MTTRPNGAGQYITRRALGGAVLAASLVTRARAAEPIQLGAVLPLTGPSAATGTQQQRGLQFAVARFNAAGGIAGRPVSIMFEDGQAKPDQSVLAFNKLADLNKVPVIFSGFSGPTLAMAPLATRKKVLLVNGGAQADRLATASPYLINTLPVVNDEVSVLARYLVDVGKKRAAILFQNDAAGTPGRDDFMAAYTALGGTVLGQEQSSFSQTDFRPALLKLNDLQPDVVFVMLTDGLSGFADQITQMKPPFMVAGTSFFSDPSARKLPGAQGFIHTQVRITAPPEIAAEFQKLTGTEMEFFGSQYYNSASIVFRTIESLLKQDREPTGEAIRARLLEIGTFNELTKTVFKKNTASMQVDIVKIEGGKDVFVKSYVSE